MAHVFLQLKRNLSLVVAACAVVGLALPSRAQTTPAQPAAVALRYAHPVDFGVSYTYLRSNLLPGCGCFSLNGGTATAQFGLVPHWAAVADFTGVTRAGITADNYKLTQLTYTFGVRYHPLRPAARVQPFGEAMFGGAHVLGTLSPGNNATGGTSNAVAFVTGGGIAIHVVKRVRLVPAQADYLLTNFRNGSANHQNDLRLSAGLTFSLQR